MGQYHKVFNLTKREFLNPHKLGNGLKLLEWGGPGGVPDALVVLLACSSGRGGGDYQSDSEMVGRWAGDQIAVIGDYSEDGDIQGVDTKEIYSTAGEEGGFRDITDELIPILEREFELVYVGDGWCDRKSMEDIEGYAGSHGHGDRMICFRPEGGRYAEFPASKVREALRNAGDGEGVGGKYTLKQLGLTTANV
ncbi:MAG: hypothetical protein E6R03_07265 [Hyphomicrobiaceae bacterium]|nr:MAG: hypothetical protein E6R03_07265 [Hyphomicrobiaceae bacterium]